MKIFIVIGRTGPSLTLSKTIPFTALEEVNEVYIFSENEGFMVEKTKYILIPSWIKRCRPVILSKAIRLLFEPLQLLYYTVKLKPDLINGIYTLPKGLNSLFAAKVSGTRCLISVIGSILEIETELPLQFFWKRINIWQLKKCDAVSIKGKTDFDYLTSSGIPSLKLFFLNGAVDTEKFTFSTSPRIYDMLFVGTFYELKGPDRFVKIVQSIKADFPHINAVMVGTGIMEKEVSEMILELNLGENIKLSGYQKNTVPYFQKSKILIMPSRSESLPTAMLEAMACGCVPIVSDVGNIREAAKDFVNSIIIKDYMDIEKYAESARELLNHDQLRIDYSIKGRQTIVDHYSLIPQSEIAKNIIQYLNVSRV